MYEPILQKCPYREPCCMRVDGDCIALTDTYFSDGKCHFRKAGRYGKNLYDKEDSIDEQIRYAVKHTRKSKQSILSFLKGEI